MKLYFYTSILISLGGLLYVNGYETGAPVLTCRTMVPGHGEAAQTTPAPYRILPSDVTSGRVRVTLTAPKANDYFTGFLIQARVPSAGDNAVGSFVQVPQDSQTLDCNEITGSGVTHGSNTKKKSVEFDWEAPSNFDGQVQFVATVVFDYATFWTGIISSPVQVRGTRDAPSLNNQNPQTARAEQGVKEIESNIYNECGRSKNCVGSPPGCIQASNCRAVVALTHFSGRYQFEMLAHDSKYVAFGLSDDNKMGGDGVIECVHEESGRGSSVSAYKSWNVPFRKQNKRVDDLFGVNLDSAAIVDGAIYCKVSLDSLIKIEDRTYDLDREEYFVLLASGSSLKPFSVGYHDVAFSSSPDKKRLSQLKAARVLDPFYNECGETKNCFGLPEGCLTTQDCVAVTAVKVDGIRYIFEMKAKNAAYVAVGLSDDQKMGGDSVIECVHENTGSNQIKAYRSWNIQNQKNNKRVPNQNEITLLNASYVDGTIYCSVFHEAVTTIEGVKFDLIQNKYNLLLAAGTSLKERSVGFHDLAYTSTAEASSLSEIKSLKPSSKILLRLHGTFMVVAWIGAASIGIVVARYYKQTWVESSCCGKDLWFGWHRLLMMFTWILSLSGSACIFLELGEWVSGPSQTHAILGVTTTVLAFFQPIFAAFRPHPDSPKRPIFNWIHWLVGNAAHIIAILTIFFAVTLSKAELPAWVDWILVVYVGFYVIIHLILSISGCLSEKSGSMRVNTFPMKDLHNGRNSMNYEQQKDNPHSGFRKFWLFIHVLFIVLITTILALIVFYAPIEPRLTALRDQFV
ncbi:putative ferric-chelate reductase 1 homolog [Daktulosphaira vitifoliae]|uniref:putative ferric-chelate reductase 1 homolog n=1 Tax=Daktulosphaira vitifoliae TaxID=58002 RepID=UPI0021AAF42C|nr:putative ferric-chelate reductase 1 homolog [Daktulosphaira vitifoliae]XP_050523393.1 putative ferric-chelate reductase 1 homolog [Daktulosphaira vitifoliae]